MLGWSSKAKIFTSLRTRAFSQRNTVPKPPLPRADNSLNSDLYLEYRTSGIPSMLSMPGSFGWSSSGAVMDRVI
eukprot:CCRYP_008278-RA/>CCRYP_008278-RA protein AED:0.00 eAED:0.00 QI:99/1/0.5/1/0/0/2/0/73